MGVKYVDVRPQILRGAVIVTRTIRLNSDKIPETWFREQIADQMARTFAKELVLRYVPQLDDKICVRSDLAIVSPDVAEVLNKIGTVAVHTLE